MSQPLDLAVKIFLLIFDGVAQFYYWVAILHILLSWLISLISSMFIIVLSAGWLMSSIELSCQYMIGFIIF